jgi:hypothetical protein
MSILSKGYDGASKEAIEEHLRQLGVRIDNGNIVYIMTDAYGRQTVIDVPASTFVDTNS